MERPCKAGGRDSSDVDTGRGSRQKLEEARESCLPEPLEAVWPCQHLDFRLLAPSTVRQYISVVLSHQVGGKLLWYPYANISLLWNLLGVEG